MKTFFKTMMLLLTLLFWHSAGHAQVSIAIEAGQTLAVDGNNSMAVAGNWVNNGVFIPGSGTVIFSGAGTQSIANPAGEIFNNLTVDKTGGDLLLNGNMTVTGNLTVNSGDLDLNSFIITMGNAALLSETPGNTVKGASGNITATRTLNAPAALNVAGLGAELTTGANLGSTEIRRGHALQIVNSDSSILRYFDITPANNSGLNATLVFHYDDSELNNLQESGLSLYRSTDGGANWTKESGTVDETFNTLTLAGIGAFSRWTAASDSGCVPGLLGDVNGDDTVNSTDALILLSFDAGIPVPQSFLDRINVGFGDANDDGNTNSTDALILISWEVGLPTPFPVGTTVCLPAGASKEKEALQVPSKR